MFTQSHDVTLDLNMAFFVFKLMRDIGLMLPKQQAADSQSHKALEERFCDVLSAESPTWAPVR